MSPRGGRGGGSSRSGSGSSSSSSSSNYNSYSYYSSSPWKQQTQLPGSKWHNGSLVITVVFNILFVLAIIGLAIYSASARRKIRLHDMHNVLGIGKWGLAMFFLFFFYLFNMIASIIQENATVVYTPWYLIRVIFFDTTYIVEILLVYIIYDLIYHLFLQPIPATASKASLKKSIMIIHGVFCLLLFIIFITILAVSIHDIVAIILGTSNILLSSNRRYAVSGQLDVAFAVLVFLAAVEAFIAAILLLITGRKRGLPTKALIFLLVLVIIPFLLNEIISLGFSTSYNLSPHALTVSAYAGRSIVPNLFRIISFFGIVAVCKQVAGSTSPTGAMPAANIAPFGSAAAGPQPAMTQQPQQQPQPQQQQQQQFSPQQQQFNPQEQQYPPQQSTSPYPGQQQQQYPQQQQPTQPPYPVGALSGEQVQSQQQPYVPYQASAPSTNTMTTSSPVPHQQAYSPPPQQQQQQAYAPPPQQYSEFAAPHPQQHQGPPAPINA